MRSCTVLPLSLLVVIVTLFVSPTPARAEEQPTREWAVRTLQQSSFFADGPISVAASLPPEHAAVVRLLEEKDAVEIFERLITGGSPSAKLYACIGLFEVDRAAFRRAVEKLRGSNLPVETMDGCFGGSRTVGAIIGESPTPADDAGAGGGGDIASGETATEVLEYGRISIERRRKATSSRAST